MNSISSISKHPYRQLVAFFAIWKTLLLGVAALSPGPGYDTSTSLVLSAAGSDKKLTPALLYLIEKLTRWDAIYFTQASRRGYLFEQEWAFGWGFTRVVSFCAVALRVAGVPHYEGLEALIAIIIAHAAHLASVLVLFHLSLAVFPGFKSRFALTTATLHIVSPAGLFLSAPYAESSCALFTFSGALLFAKSFVSKGKAAASHDLFVLASGILFGISTTFRSNGILSGLLLLEEAFRVVISLKEGFETAKFRRLILTGIGGMCVGAGFFVPQFIAYNEYCGQENALLLRPWCGERIPSIYTFVQEHYWNCGLFRYWTISNVPLFLLAAPMISIITMSIFWVSSGSATNGRGLLQQGKRDNKLPHEEERPVADSILLNLAMSQSLLLLLTLTTAHVQIITRISSAYPVWMWYLAALARKEDSLWGENLVRFLVIYALIQGGLFATFLPPA